jgi:hypothetical protein
VNVLTGISGKYSFQYFDQKCIIIAPEVLTMMNIETGLLGFDAI